MGYIIIEPTSGAVDGIYTSKADADAICADLNNNDRGLKFFVNEAEEDASLRDQPAIHNQPWFRTLWEPA
jgi:hypothetical protein